MENIRIVNQETIQTTDEIIKIITKDHVKIPGIETITNRKDKENFLSQHTEKIHNVKIHNKTIKAVPLNTEDKLMRYNLLNRFNQTLPVLIIQKIQNYK